MTKEASDKHFIRQWRNLRGLSLRRLAERMELEPGEELISAMSLSRIERGDQPYSQPILEALAVALDTEAWCLLEVDPMVDSEVVDLVSILRGMNAAERDRALRILRAANE